MCAMPVSRRVSVERNRLRFAAAHMATFAGTCEPLHGHNYDVMVELEGELTVDSWVWDFGDLKRRARAVCEQLDHRFLLQRESELLTSRLVGDGWEVRFNDRRYVFPEHDVAALAIDNTTAERLAEWFAGRLLETFPPGAGKTLRKLTVGIEEMPGQTGWYTVAMASMEQSAPESREDG